MEEHVQFFINRLKEKLWIRPLVLCVISVAGAFLAKMMDYTDLGKAVPIVNIESIEALLTIISASMLVISTFAVASMVSAYSAVGSNATPRAFKLVVADDVSQNALSAFIGAFIFSIVAVVALKTSYYGQAGLFSLFVLTLFTFIIVILMFLKWVDRIARLGRLGTTIDRVEEAAIKALAKRRISPHLGGVPIQNHHDKGQGIYSSEIGYVQHIDMSSLQKLAEANNIKIIVNALPGTFAVPGRALAYLTSDDVDLTRVDRKKIEEAFVIDDGRVYDEDPRFGLIALSEIASRALSPAVNDPGTAIHIIGTFVRIFVHWMEPITDEERLDIVYNRVEVPELDLEDMFEDAFTGIARDGAGTVEVGIRLQKAFVALSTIENKALRKASIHHSKLALARAELALDFPDDLARLKHVAQFIKSV